MIIDPFYCRQDEGVPWLRDSNVFEDEPSRAWHDIERLKGLLA